jgi:hypothetical protein
VSIEKSLMRYPAPAFASSLLTENDIQHGKIFLEWVKDVHPKGQV